MRKFDRWAIFKITGRDKMAIFEVGDVYFIRSKLFPNWPPTRGVMGSFDSSFEYHRDQYYLVAKGTGDLPGNWHTLTNGPGWPIDPPDDECDYAEVYDEWNDEVTKPMVDPSKPVEQSPEYADEIDWDRYNGF